MTPTLAERQVTILNGKGLHMRPATRFVKLASSFQSEVQVIGNGTTANGKSILDMTILAAECGSTLEISVQGPDAEEAATSLAELVARRFDMMDDGDNEAV
jgi:phosphocarrier protein